MSPQIIPHWTPCKIDGPLHPICLLYTSPYAALRAAGRSFPGQAALSPGNPPAFPGRNNLSRPQNPAPSPVPPTRSSGRTAPAFSFSDKDVYKRQALVENGRLKAILLLGDISASGIFQYLIKNEVPLPCCDRDIFRLTFADFYGFDKESGKDVYKRQPPLRFRIPPPACRTAARPGPDSLSPATSDRCPRGR